MKTYPGHSENCALSLVHPSPSEEYLASIFTKVYFHDGWTFELKNVESESNLFGLRECKIGIYTRRRA